MAYKKITFIVFLIILISLMIAIQYVYPLILDKYLLSNYPKYQISEIPYNASLFLVAGVIYNQNNSNNFIISDKTGTFILEKDNRYNCKKDINGTKQTAYLYSDFKTPIFIGMNYEGNRINISNKTLILDYQQVNYYIIKIIGC